MAKGSNNAFPKLIIQEAANDGSDFSNPAADFRVLFLGEDGKLHVKDSAGAVTDPYTGGGSQVYPHSMAIEAFEVPFANTGFSTPDFLVNQQFYIGSGAQNDFVTYRKLLAAGTWSFALEHYVRTARGINTISISADNSSWTDLGTIDSYAASPSSGNGTDTRSVLAGVTIPSDGLWYVRVKGATKNASSSGYGLVVIRLHGTRTGA